MSEDNLSASFRSQAAYAFDWMREERLIGQIELSDHSNITKALLSHSNTMKTLVIFIPLLLFFSSTCWKVIKHESRSELADFNMNGPPVSGQLIISNFLEVSWKKIPTEPQIFFSPYSPLFFLLVAKFPRQITLKSKSISGLYCSDLIENIYCFFKPLYIITGNLDVHVSTESSSTFPARIFDLD